MSDILQKSYPFEVKFQGSPDLGVVAGIASPFYGDADSHGDIVQPGAFRDSIKDPTVIPMLWSHDPSRPVGKWINLKETVEGLEVEGRLNMGSTAGQEAFRSLKFGDTTGLSIGYAVEPGGAERRSKGGRLLTKIRLMEISLVTIPSAPSARVTEIKSLASAGELKTALRGLGLSKAAAEKVTRGGWPALADMADPTPEIIQNLRSLREAAAEFRKGL